MVLNPSAEGTKRCSGATTYNKPACYVRLLSISLSETEVFDMALAAACLVISLLAGPAVYDSDTKYISVDHIFGDSAGWSQGVDYKKWASGKRFSVSSAFHIFVYQNVTNNLLP